MINGKVMSDLAHPNTTREVRYDSGYVLRSLKHLSCSSCTLVSFLAKLKLNTDIEDQEAKELLRLYVMRVWKSIRCFKLAAFTSDVMLEVLFMPVYAGEDIWIHETVDTWKLGVRIRDSPIIETLTIGMIVIIGLLCASAPISRILSAPDVFSIRRANTMLTEIRDIYQAKETHSNEGLTSGHIP
jgi:hypothetical protein